MMRLPALKLQGVLILIATGTVGYWLGGIGPTVLLGGIIVYALATFSLRKRGRVAGEIKAEGERVRSLSGVGLVGYSIAVVLAFVWLATIWTWQVYEHEAFKLRQSTAPSARARP